MNDDALRVEFKVDLGGRRPAPKPEPVSKGQRQRLDRAARKARNLALAFHIDHLIRSGQVADLATVGRICGVSRARVSKIGGLLNMSAMDQERVLRLEFSEKELAKQNPPSNSKVYAG